MASALLAACTTLYSEDMQAGLRIEQELTIFNPFEGIGPLIGGFLFAPRIMKVVGVCDAPRWRLFVRREKSGTRLAITSCIRDPRFGKVSARTHTVAERWVDADVASTRVNTIMGKVIGRARVALMVTMALNALIANAADEADPRDCKPNGNQQQMNACAVRDYRASDAKLNIRYRLVMESLPAERRIALRLEQNEWIKQRNQRCKAEAKSNEGGSIWPLEFYGCLDKLTAERTKAFNGESGRR